MEKELIKLEKVADKISKILQTEYELDEFSADTYAFMFLETNFQKVEKPKPSKIEKVYTYLTTTRKQYPYTSPLDSIKSALLTITIIVALIGVASGLGYLAYENAPVKTYKASVSDTYKFPSYDDWGNGIFSEQGIVVEKRDGDAFNKANESLEEGQTTQLRTVNGMLLNVTKRNHQLWLDRVNE